MQFMGVFAMWPLIGRLVQVGVIAPAHDACVPDEQGNVDENADNVMPIHLRSPLLLFPSAMARNCSMGPSLVDAPMAMMCWRLRRGWRW